MNTLIAIAPTIMPERKSRVEKKHMPDKETQQRTTRQNRALHKLFGDISNFCVETGLDQRTVVNKLNAYSCPTSPQFVKETWRAMQIAITGKTSTADLTTKEIDQVYDVFNKFWSEITGEHFSFPSWEELTLNQLDERL